MKLCSIKAPNIRGGNVLSAHNPSMKCTLTQSNSKYYQINNMFLNRFSSSLQGCIAYTFKVRKSQLKENCQICYVLSS